MPQTNSQASQQLGIRLDREHPTYTLPDTVTGHVFRKAHVVAPKATLTIALVGRSKTRLVVRHGHLTRTYRGRFPLVDEAEHTQTLLEAPLHIPSSGQEMAWPFAIPLPTNLDPRITPSDTTQDESFLALEGSGRGLNRLPPSFTVQQYGFGEGMECFAEYFLRAILKIGSSSKDMAEAILPLTITTLDHEVAAGLDRWRESLHERSIEKSRIKLDRVDSHAGGSSATAAETRKTYLNFALSVKTACSLRLDQSSTIPFLVWLIPRSSELEGMELSTLPEVSVEKITVELVASTNIRCRARRGVRAGSAEKKFRLTSTRHRDAMAALRIPWRTGSDPTNADADSRHVSSSYASNFGSLLNLRLPGQDLSEDFKVHNIQHAHRLDWQMIGQVAGQSFTSSGSEAVRILAPSSSDVPVDYTSLEAQDDLQRRQFTGSDIRPPGYERDLPLPLPSRRDSGMAHGLSRLWTDY